MTDLKTCINQTEKLLASFDKLLQKLEPVKDDSEFRFNRGGLYYSIFHEERSRWKGWFGILSRANQKSWLPWKKREVQTANERAENVRKHFEDHQKEIAGIQAEFKEVFTEFDLYENRIKHGLETEEYKKALVKALKKLWEVCATVKDRE